MHLCRSAWQTFEMGLDREGDKQVKRHAGNIPTHTLVSNMPVGGGRVDKANHALVKQVAWKRKDLGAK